MRRIGLRLRSAVFQSYKAYRDAERAALHNRFCNLDPIKFNYEVSLGYAGRWLVILEKSYPDTMATYHLAEAFLLDVAIVEFVFLEETASVRESQVYHDWFLENEAREMRDPFSDADDDEKPWHWRLDLKLKVHGCQDAKERSASIVSEVRARVSSEDPDEEVVDLIAAERGRFLSSDMDFESARSSVISSGFSSFSSDSFSLSFLDLLAKIEEYLQEWDVNSRSAGWDVLAVEAQKEEEAIRAELEELALVLETEKDVG